MVVVTTKDMETYGAFARRFLYHSPNAKKFKTVVVMDKAKIGFAAVRQGLGMSTLPCFVGDADPLLVRAPGTRTHMHGTLWLLTQGETRRTKRVQLFTEFISRRLAAYAALFAGLCSRSE